MKDHRIVWVDVGQGWRNTFRKWFKENGMHIIGQGWTRNSTGWGFQVDTQLTPDELQDKLWNEVPGAGNISIETGYVDDDVEEEDTPPNARYKEEAKIDQALAVLLSEGPKVRKASVNKQVNDLLKASGFKIEDRETTSGAIKTWRYGI